MVHSDSDDDTWMKYRSKEEVQEAAKNDDPDNNVIEPPTKSLYRKLAWSAVTRLYSGKVGIMRYIKRKVPLFPEALAAAKRLADTPEFQEAKNIKVDIDKPQEAVKIMVLKANKTLFVTPRHKSECLYAKIEGSENLEEIDLADTRGIVKLLAGKDTYQEIAIDQAEPLDMIVVGCVAVSQRGQRIGKGNGYVDLSIAVLHTLGLITRETVIATTVADKQVFPEFPTELFQDYDFTVDLIVTPTRVIRVDPRPEQRTIGVQWGLLSSRRLAVMRVLKPLKKHLEDMGKKIELKEEDTDVESFAVRRSNVGGRARKKFISKSFKYPKYNRGDDDAEPEPRTSYDRGGAGDANPAQRSTGNGGGGGGGMSQRRKRPFRGGRMRPTNNKSGGGENAPNNGGRVRQQKPSSRPPRQLKPQLQDGVRIRVSNMFSVPFKEFKEELRNRDCYPAKINQNRNGRCVLIFPKRDDAEEQVQVDELLQKLADMRISVPQKNSTELKQVKLKCELQPKSREFDENDATSVTSAANRAAKKAAEVCTKLANNTDNTAATDKDPDANTNAAAHLNLLVELAAEVNAATLLAARAAKAAEAIAQKVLQEVKPSTETANKESKEENKEEVEHTAKLVAQIETLTKAGAEALAAGTKAEAAAAANATNSTNTTTSTTDGDAPVTESAGSKKEGITAMNDAIQEAARATAAVSFAVATLYEIIPTAPAQQTVAVASIQTLTRLFGALLPKV
ncbi:uncharacterized protein LOC126563927 [Anopheles maculipalpis]|uniref:uncharacterized protein LOC126563927 n=1 Tax=Anopheles maculipalpis TaxID=1496333 RepID=UPI002159509C|nr:uncharacterized protein LOC126563927 [Anopheles maculipalpis]